jgi:hypothetical protein
MLQNSSVSQRLINNNDQQQQPQVKIKIQNRGVVLSSKDIAKKTTTDHNTRPQISPRVSQKVKTALDEEEDELLNRQGMGMPRMSDQIYAI